MQKGSEKELSLPQVYTVTLPRSGSGPIAVSKPLIESEVTSDSLVLRAKIATDPFSRTKVTNDPPGMRDNDRWPANRLRF